MGLRKILLLLPMGAIGDLLGDQGGVAVGAVIDDEVNLDLVLCALVYDCCRVLDHLRIRHPTDHFVKREGLSIGFLVVLAQGSDKADDGLISGVEKFRSHLA
jgi:hypothetical protein